MTLTITEISKENHASRFVKVVNHTSDCYAQSRLMRLIVARSGIKLIIWVPSRHGKPLCHPDDRSQVTTIHSTLVVFWFSMLYELLLRKTVNQWAFNKIIIIIIIIVVVVGKGFQIWKMCMLEVKFHPVKPVYNGRPWEMASWPL